MENPEQDQRPRRRQLDRALAQRGWTLGDVSLFVARLDRRTRQVDALAAHLGVSKGAAAEYIRLAREQAARL